VTHLIATTIAPWKCDGTELDWLSYAETWIDEHDVHFLAVLEGDPLDGRYRRLRRRLHALDPASPDPDASDRVTVWSFTTDTGARTITTPERLHRICTGRNLATEYARRTPDIEGIWHLDTDIVAGPDALTRILEVDWPIVGLNVASYCLDGPRLYMDRDSFTGTMSVSSREPDGNPRPGKMATTHWRHHAPPTVDARDGRPFPDTADIRLHWNTAGCLYVRRHLALDLSWRWNPDRGMTDDPSYAEDALRLGWPTWTRHDEEAGTPPLEAVEDRPGPKDIDW
jgi:hypothetical protein